MTDPGHLIYSRDGTRSLDPNRVVTDQDQRNGLSSIMEFVGEAIRIAHADGPEKAKDYCEHVARDLASGTGHPAPSQGPVTPDKPS